MDGHPSRPPVARWLQRRTRSLGGPRQRDLLRLAPDGVWLAIASPRCWWALTPPFHPYPERLRRVFRSWRFPFCATVHRLSPSGISPASCPAVSGLSSDRLAPARGHPACTSNCSPAFPAFSSRSLKPHSGQQTAAAERKTNSPQTGHSRLTPRMSATSSWSSVRLSGATTVTVGGTPPRPCPGSRRAVRRSARGRRSRAGAECARPLGRTA